jgi:hypothetical protein
LDLQSEFLCPIDSLNRHTRNPSRSCISRSTSQSHSISDSISQRASLFTYHLVHPGYSPVPSSRSILIGPRLLTRSRINYVISGSGSVLRTDTSSSLATDPTLLTSSRTCHRHVTLTITDQGCTKAAIFIPCNEDITAEETAALYIKHVFAHFGLPTKIISDRDPRFMSKFIQAACKVTGINHAPSTAYHPRTDGQSERSNQWLETAIRFITDQKQKNWAPYLPIAQFAHNNWPSDTTRKSPFFLLMGFNPRADWVHATSPIPRVTLRLEQLKEARIQARDAMIKAQQSWVKHRDTPKYKEGDQVWLEGKNLRINQPTAKLAPRRHGPFKIIQVMSAVNYRLELPTQWSIHPMFHIDLLTPYRETTMHGPNFTRPTPELIDGEEEYSVEKILDSRRFGRRRRLQYLVKWEGYPDSDNMWVDKDDVFAEDKVREFKASNPGAETHIRTSIVAKSPHPHPLNRSQLLHTHALHYMSSDGNDDLAHEYSAGAVADSPIPHSQEFPINTPVMSTPLSPSSTSPPLDPSLPLPRPLFLDLSQPRPQPRTSQPCSDSSVSILPPLSPLTVSAPLNKPLKRLLFRTPCRKAKGSGKR